MLDIITSSQIKFNSYDEQLPSMVVVSAREYLRKTYMYVYVHLYIDKLNLSVNAFDSSLYSDYYGLSVSGVEEIDNIIVCGK